MKFKTNNPAAVPTTPRQITQAKYNRSRYNLLLVAIVSVINLFSLSLSQTYFLFSAQIPSFFVELFVYTEEGAVAPFADLIIPIIIGIILTIPYLLCFFFSKKRPGWMVVSLVFFAFDCIFLVTMYYLSDVIIDLLFHGWVMFYLITGVTHGFKLKKMPEDEPLPSFQEIASEEAPVEAPVLTEEEAVEIDAQTDVEISDETVSEKEEPVIARSFDEIMAENQKKDL